VNTARVAITLLAGGVATALVAALYTER